MCLSPRRMYPDGGAHNRAERASACLDASGTNPSARGTVTNLAGYRPLVIHRHIGASRTAGHSRHDWEAVMKTAAFFALMGISVLFAQTSAQAEVPKAISAAVADTSRPEADRTRDANRKPDETLAFTGVKAGYIVADYAAGS